MVLRMKKFNNFGVHWIIRLSGGSQGFPEWGTGAPPPSNSFFRKPFPPSKPMPPMEHLLTSLKNEAPPSGKQTPPPSTLKREVPFHEMTPRNRTINNNLRSSYNPSKYVWRSSFLVNLQACKLIAGNFTTKWTPSQIFVDSILSPPCSPHVLT